MSVPALDTLRATLTAHAGDVGAPPADLLARATTRARARQRRRAVATGAGAVLTAVVVLGGIAVALPRHQPRPAVAGSTSCPVPPGGLAWSCLPAKGAQAGQIRAEYLNEYPDADAQVRLIGRIPGRENATDPNKDVPEIAAYEAWDASGKHPIELLTGYWARYGDSYGGTDFTPGPAVVTIVGTTHYAVVPPETAAVRVDGHTIDVPRGQAMVALPAGTASIGTITMLDGAGHELATTGYDTGSVPAVPDEHPTLLGPGTPVRSPVSSP